MVTATSKVVAPARPFIKCVGGKTQLLGELLVRVPEKFGHYYEPFVGGGALFFELSRTRILVRGATLNDSNERLMRTYHALRERPAEVVGWLRKHETWYREDPECAYYELRRREPTADAELAAWFIFLNKTCFNGLWRVNKKNQMNVPVGKFKSPPAICDEENLYAVSRALHGVTLFRTGFEEAVEGAGEGDFVYFDPPYVPASKIANFTAYTAGGFGPKDQERLRDVALGLKERGVHVLLSNSDTEPVRELYAKGFKVERVEARRNVNSKADRRGVVGEVLVT